MMVCECPTIFWILRRDEIACGRRGAEERKLACEVQQGDRDPRVSRVSVCRVCELRATKVISKTGLAVHWPCAIRRRVRSASRLPRPFPRIYEATCRSAKPAGDSITLRRRDLLSDCCSRCPLTYSGLNSQHPFLYYEFLAVPPRASGYFSRYPGVRVSQTPVTVPRYKKIWIIPTPVVVVSWEETRILVFRLSQRHNLTLNSGVLMLLRLIRELT